MKRFFLITSSLCATAFLGWFYSQTSHDTQELTTTLSSQNPHIEKHVAPPPPPTQEVVKTVQKNSTTYTTLQNLGINAQEIHRILQVSKEHKMSLNKVQPGTKIKVTVGKDGWEKLTFESSIESSFIIRRQDDKLTAEHIQHPVTIHHRSYEGIVSSTLWESAVTSGLRGPLIMDLVEIFAWQVDFERQVRPKDAWRLIIEEKEIRGQPAGWGAILAAEYINQDESYMAFRYETKQGHHEYYDLHGDNLRGKFLRSPLKYSRISSKFHAKRFHPILKVHRPHYGVDYAAPTGTPIRAVGDGVIEVASFHRGSGNTLKIRHNSVYKTAYKHLQKFRAGMRRGRKVRQGDIIGYVGSTGLATGPHLHFEFYENGRYTDPLGRRFPRESPIDEKIKPAFLAHVKRMQQDFPSFDVQARYAQAN